MSRTLQKQRTETETITEVQSLTLVRNVIRSSISSIAYLRYLFPEESFTETQIAGLKIKTLVPGENEEVSSLTQWLEQGVFDALERHYLRALVFSIFSRFNDPSSLLESYTFKFTYPSDGNISMDVFAKAGNDERQLSFMKKDQIQQAWCTMIRTLITISHALPPLPQERYLAMRLFYYDEITPKDYQPPGFVHADDAPAFEFVEDSERVEIGGAVATKHHTVSIRLDTAMPSVEIKNKENIDELFNRAFVEVFDRDKISIKQIAEMFEIDKERSKLIMNELEKVGLIANGKGSTRKVIRNDETRKIYQELTLKTE